MKTLPLLAAAVLWQLAAFGQAGPTTRGDLLSPQELATLETAHINSPPTPPPGVVRPLALEKGAASKTLAVPTSTWTYGCTATSAGMIFAYYDRNGYPAMYTGPCNGGVCPMTDVGQGINIPILGSCSIIATQNGFDGRATPGHVDDYWIAYQAPGPDPWQGVRPEHAWGDCTADYLGTNQWKWDHDLNGATDTCTDGETWVTFPGSAARLYDYIPPVIVGMPQTEACHGMRLFAESRGYTVVENYTQMIDTVYAGGFSFADYKAEINAGYPVMIHLEDHTIVGVGYDDTANTVFLNDTWDNLVHIMTWGGIYASMYQRAVTVIHLAPDTTPPTGTIVINNNRSSTNSSNVTLGLTWSDGIGSGVARMRFSDNGSTWSAWEALQTARAYTLAAGTDGHRTVRAQFLDKANNRSAVYCDYIRLDTTPPKGSIIINGGASTTTTQSVTLGLTWSDDGAGVSRMRFSDNGSTWTAWMPLEANHAHMLPAGLGYHTVRVQYLDGANNCSTTCNDYIKLVAP